MPNRRTVLLITAMVALAMSLAQIVDAQASQPAGADTLVEKIQHDVLHPSTQAATTGPAVPHGTMLRTIITDSPRYPGTESNIQIYVPAQYDPATPACLLVKLDGLGGGEANALDKLIASKEVPIIIGVGIAPAAIFKDPPGTAHRSAVRFDRSFEFDSTNDRFPDFVLEEVLPAVERLKMPDGRPIRISHDGNDHAATGASTGGIGSFTLAWRRPDQFSRVYSIIGTFVSMRGGSNYPVLIRKTDPKPIRIFLEDGTTDAWNPLFGSWYDANLNMESALRFSGYDVAHAWGVHGHDGRPGQFVFPDVMRWLWRDYPAPITPGTSQNSTLRDITLPGQQWQLVTMPAGVAPTGLAANSHGEIFVSDPTARTVYRLGDNASTQPQGAQPYGEQKYAITAEAFGPDDMLYGVVPSERKIIAIAPDKSVRTIATDITGHDLTVTHDGTIYTTETGEHSDEPSHVWRIQNGKKQLIDEGLSSASGLAFSPDQKLLFVAEQSTQWIYSYVVQPDGTLTDKQPFYWLHTTDVPNNSGAQDIAVDSHGELYVATRMGVQVCDQNGRVRAILPLPTPSGPVVSLCFGGEKSDTLYATDGKHVFRRTLKTHGILPFAKPTTYPSEGAG